MGMFDFVIKPMNVIIDTVNFVLCLISYLGNVFRWMGTAVAVSIKIILAGRLCFLFYIFHAFWEFFLFILFEVILILILWPSSVIGSALGYPLIIPNNRKNLRDIKRSIGARNLYEMMSSDLITKCYSFDPIPPFPKWNLKVPSF